MTTLDNGNNLETAVMKENNTHGSNRPFKDSNHTYTVFKNNQSYSFTQMNCSVLSDTCKHSSPSKVRKDKVVRYNKGKERQGKVRYDKGKVRQSRVTFVKIK